MGIVRTPRALILVLDSEGKVTGHELEVFVTYEPDGKDDPMAGMFQAQVKREPIEPEKFAEMNEESDGLLAAECKGLNGKVAELQEALKEAQAQLQAHEKARRGLGTVIAAYEEKIATAKAALE